MPVGLTELTQSEWSGGMCRSVARHLIPDDAAYDILDGLLDENGNVYQRGPTAHLTPNQLGASLVAVWEAQFSAGRRTLGLAATAFGLIKAGAWSVMAFISSISGGGLMAQVGEYMLFPYTLAGAPKIGVYAGSQQPVGYTAGGLTVTAGSATVTGAGTSFLADVDAGMIMKVGAPGSEVWGVVKSVETDTSLTLVDTWDGPTAAGTAGTFRAFEAYRDGTAVTASSGRAFVATGRKVLMSQPIDQDTGHSQLFDAFSVDDVHEFPADVVALATLRDVVYVFTKAGIWSISGGALPIVDTFGNAQHRVQRISGDVVLRSPGGLAPWRDSLVVCAVDGAYVMEANGELELISRSIGPLWQSMMASGVQVGQVATFRDHVFVPVGGANGVYVGRLDRRTKTPVGESAPWTRFVQGEALAIGALAVQDPYGSPKLVAGASTSGFLIDLTGVFGSGALPAPAGGLTDANGVTMGMVVETRQYVVDAGGLAMVRDVALEYESTDGLIGVEASIGQRAAAFVDPTYTSLASTAAGNYATQQPRVLGVRREARRVSYRIRGFTGVGLGVTGWRLRAVRTRSRIRGRRR